MIKIKDLGYGIKAKALLSGISAEFEEGRIHGIVGNNGSGKTLLLKSVSGYLKPTAGSIHVGGKRLYGEISFPPSMGLILEAPGFLPYVSGKQNLKWLAGIQKKVDKKRIERALEMVGLVKEANKLFAHYSLGMRQRLGIAQAIMDEPRLLIMDEPFNSLDEDGLTIVRKLFLDLRSKGVTILLTSHNPRDISLLCDTVHEMHSGTLSSAGVGGLA